MTVAKCHYSSTTLMKKKKKQVQAIAMARNIRTTSKKTGKPLKKKTVVRLILHKSRKRLGLKKRRQVGPYLRYHSSQKCRSLVITRRKARRSARLAKK